MYNKNFRMLNEEKSREIGNKIMGQKKFFINNDSSIRLLYEKKIISGNDKNIKKIFKIFKNYNNS